MVRVQQTPISIHFGRALTPEEKPLYTSAVSQALALLGKDRVALIAHAPSFPDAPGEPTGIGSPLTNGGRKFQDFIAQLGFNRVQLGPNGILKPFVPSPYQSSAFSLSPFLIDLDALAADPYWCGLLKPEQLAALRKQHPAVPNADPNRVDYHRAFELYDAALRQAYENWRYRKQHPQFKPITAGAMYFNSHNRQWLNRDVLYSLLSGIYGNDYWPNWPDELDRNLFNPNYKNHRMAKFRIADLEREHYSELDYLRFVQFLADRQMFNARRDAYQNQRNGKPVASMMGDAPIAFSDRDVWAYRNAFLDDWRMGAPPDEFAADGQAWGFPVLNPEAITKEIPWTNNQTRRVLGPAGDLLKARFEKLFSEYSGGLRIDHVIGLIDPWVYSQSHGFKSADHPAGRLYSSPESTDLNPFSLIEKNQLNPNTPADSARRVRSLTDEQKARYETVLSLIVDAANKHKIPLENIMGEDLGGEPTLPVKTALSDKHIGGVRVTQFEHHLNRIDADNWATTGSHDNEPLLVWAQQQKQTAAIKPQANHLTQTLAPNDNLISRFFLRQKLKHDPQALVQAKFAELFASPAKSLQIFFADFFGMTDSYNRPGVNDPTNWTLRIPQNFEDFYYDQLAKGKGLNLPDALKTALHARGEDANHPELTHQLETLAALLKT